MKVDLNSRMLETLIDDNRLLIRCKIHKNTCCLKLLKRQTGISYRRLSNKTYNYFSNKVLHVRLL